MTPPPTAKRPTADHFALNAQYTQLLLAEARMANLCQRPSTEESEAAYAEAVGEIKKQQQEVLEQLNKVQKGEKGWNVYEGEGKDAYSASITEQVKTKKIDAEKDPK